VEQILCVKEAKFLYLFLFYGYYCIIFHRFNSTNVQTKLVFGSEEKNLSAISWKAKSVPKIYSILQYLLESCPTCIFSVLVLTGSLRCNKILPL
jgi:hypothetical protein